MLIAVVYYKEGYKWKPAKGRVHRTESMEQSALQHRASFQSSDLLESWTVASWLWPVAVSTDDSRVSTGWQWNDLNTSEEYNAIETYYVC